MASREETEKEKGTIKYSKKVGILLEQNNIIFLLSRGLLPFFKVLVYYPEPDYAVESRIEYWSKEYAQRGKCIFSMCHPNLVGINLMYLSEMTEEELLKLINLKVFW